VKQGLVWVSLDLHLALDLSLYEGKQGHTTPTRLWKNAHIAKALLTRLLTAPLSFKEQDHWHHENGQSPSAYPLNYPLSLRKVQPWATTPVAPVAPTQEGKRTQALTRPTSSGIWSQRARLSLVYWSKCGNQPIMPHCLAVFVIVSPIRSISIICCYSCPHHCHPSSCFYRVY